MLEGKKILLGVTGSIAAYKAAILIRSLVKSGAEVKVVMTASASAFISPLTLSTLSNNPVQTGFVKNEVGEWVNHVDLGLWADLIVIAPASANTIAKFANGICDNLLSAVYLSARCPVFIAPAMDLDMYAHASTQQNLQKLMSFGNHMIEPNEGELASGLYGKGRLAEPEEIISIIENYFGYSQILKGKKVLVTAGPTREALDPVRFISNHSTGKMGYAIAEHLAALGAEVTLVSGPVQVKSVDKSIKLVMVESAQEMYEASELVFENTDIAVFSAAVADYTPAVKSATKIKKNDAEMSIALQKTVDIAAELGKLKKRQFTVGFALETDNEEQHALGKLERKNFDMIVLNSLRDEGAGFGHDTNKISILKSDGSRKEFGLKSKKAVAGDIVAEMIASIINKS